VHVIGCGEAAVARVAARQQSVVTRSQLIDAGLSRRAIGYRLSNGELMARHPGIYRLATGPPQPLSDETAAVLYCAGYGVLSDRTAAAMWGMLESFPDAVMLTVVGRNYRSRPGLQIRRVSTIDPRDLRILHGLPVTAPARTVLDMTADASDAELETAIAKGFEQGLLKPADIHAATERARNTRDKRRLLAVFDRDGGRMRYTRSEAERRFLRLMRAAQLPLPRVNFPLLGYVADFFWPEHKLVVEVDGLEYHSGERSFHGDRRRDQRMVAAGLAVARVTWEHLTQEPFAVVARVAQTLAARST
jgi:very-short-patch-repair endonuclease